jgi:hypothetical protein
MACPYYFHALDNMLSGGKAGVKLCGFWACVLGKIWYNVVPIGSEDRGEDFFGK